MVKLQILSKCLNTGSFDIVTQNNLTEDYFLEYEEEFNFIRRHVSLYGKVPDKETMLQNFPDFPITEVKETDDFLISTLREEYLYSQMVSVVQETADKMRDDSREALNYLSAQVVALNSQNIQVLSPTKKGMLGTKELNKILQEKLNPNINKEPEKASMGAIFRTGDRVMQIKNNYDINWERKSFGEKEIGRGVFNGEIGTILKVDEKEKQIEIKFDDEKIAKYEFSDLDQIEHSYAITIHKAQRK